MPRAGLEICREIEACVFCGSALHARNASIAGEPPRFGATCRRCRPHTEAPYRAGRTGRTRFVMQAQRICGMLLDCGGPLGVLVH